MLHSMTGYGKATFQLGNKNYFIEIKTLNSKTIDINFKSFVDVRSNEIIIRKQLTNLLLRGKVDVFILEEKNNTNSVNLNFSLIENYYHQLQAFGKNKNIPLGEIMPSILRFQDITKATIDDINENDFVNIENAINEAVAQVTAFRIDEGSQLEKDILQRIATIDTLKNELAPFETERIEKVKEKLQLLFQKYAQNIADKNRFEEELIYYLEKIDINEEKVRLDTHCKYFLEIIKEDSVEKGKKLGFLAQEIGREINTIGSKANDAAMQKIVVRMKDELEKIKEQVSNIL